MKYFRIKSSILLMIFMSALLALASKVEEIGAYESQTFMGSEIRSIIRDHVEANMPWPQGTIRMEFTGKAGDLNLKGEKITYQVQGSPKDDFIGNTSYTIKFFDDGCLLKEVAVRVNIEVLQNFVVAVKPLFRNAKIGREDVGIVQRWVSRVPSNAIADPDEAIGMNVSMSIRPQTELTHNMLRKDPAIKKGKMVRVMLDGGSLSIQTIGLSEQEGAVGDIIKVLNASSKKVIYARVIGDSVVQVIF